MCAAAAGAKIAPRAAARTPQKRRAAAAHPDTRTMEINPMIQNIINTLKDVFPPELVVFLISLLPVAELRGGLIAASILKIPLALAFPICVVGNMLPIPFLLIFLKRIFSFLRRKSKTMERFVSWLEGRAQRKSGAVKKYRLVGLFCLVAIPLPGTGAWTGALVADAMGIRIKQSLVAITLGVIAAGIIMSVVSYIIPGLFF